MVPFYDSQSPMDMPLFQQLQLTPPSPKPDHQSFFQQLQLTPPSPKPDHQSYFHYSSPSFAAAEGFHLGYLGTDIPQLLPPMPPTDQPPPVPLPMPKADGYNVQQGGVAGGRAVRKDRHSKICTAGGMRDRRMRLSLDVARRFFALQDMLGFDKASKTVQWLLNMSKAAIRELMRDEPSSGCEEDGSSTLSDCKHKPVEAAEGGKTGRNEGKRGNGARKANTNPKPKPPRRVLANYAHPVPDKESRAKARERARERTREKNRLRWATLASTINVESSPINLNYSSSMNNEGKMRDISMASESSDVILAFDNVGAAAYNNGYCSQEQWELGEVVFANSQFY